VDTFVAPTGMQRVDVTGSDRVRYLEDVTSQHLLDVPVTHVRGALVLDAHGAPNAMFDVVVLGDRLALLVPDDGVRQTVMDVLAQRTFLLDARFEARGDEIVSVRGEQALEVVSRAGLTVVAGRCRVAGDLLLVSRPGGMDIGGPGTAVQEAVRALLEAGARQGNEADLEDWRVAQGEPAWGREVAPPHLPEEIGLLPTHVHLAKGCYPGQEAVARMWMLGRPRRRLAVVAVEGTVSAGWRAGAGRELVELTSIAADGTRALAFVPAGTDVGATFRAEDGDDAVVTVARLIGDGAVPPGHDPAVTRRRDRR
jgi:tRNA-modifying protein YgfZ